MTGPASIVRFATFSVSRLYRLHRTIGWLIVLPLLVITGSGLVLVFVDQLRDSLAPYSLAEPIEPPLTPVELIEEIQRAKPDMRLTRLYLPSSNRQTARVLLRGDNEKQLAFLHPGTGEIVRIRKASEQDWLGWLYQFHQGKWLGQAGQLLFSLCGGGVFVLWLFGLRLYKSVPGKKTSMAYHRRIGLCLGGLLAAFAMCGALLNYAAPSQRWLKPTPAAPLDIDTERRLTIQELLIFAGKNYTVSPLERVYIDHPVSGVVMLRFQDSARLYLNKQSGRSLQQELPLSHWLDWLYPLHSGRLFGRLRYPLLFVFGLSLLFLTISGMFSVGRRRQSSEGVYLPASRQKITIHTKHLLKKADSNERRP